MATQYDPIAKDESLNTTESPSRNIADVLAQGLAAIVGAMPTTELANLSDVTISVPSNGQTLKYNSITQKWENANDAGGHVIEEQDGTDMTQRANLQFVDAHITDNALDNKTEVEIAKEVTEAAFDALNPVGTEYDGAYLMEVADATPLTADMVGYDGGTVKGKLDELNECVNGKILAQVTADGVKKYSEILNALVSVMSETPTPHSVLRDNNQYSVFVESNGTGYKFSRTTISSNHVTIVTFYLAPGASNVYGLDYSGGSWTITDHSNTVVPSGQKFILYK